MRVRNLFHSQSHTVFAWIKSTQVDDGIHRSFLSNGTCYSNFVPTASEFYPLRPYINHVLCNLILKFEIEIEIVCNKRNDVILLSFCLRDMFKYSNSHYCILMVQRARENVRLMINQIIWATKKYYSIKLSNTVMSITPVYQKLSRDFSECYYTCLSVNIWWLVFSYSHCKTLKSNVTSMLNIGWLI